MTTQTTAADRFLDAVSLSWDSREPWEATAERGLSETDADALRDLCAETGEDYDAAAAEVLAAVRAKVAADDTTDTVYVVRDASGEYLAASGRRTPASDEAREFETREEAAAACERTTDHVLTRD